MNWLEKLKRIPLRIHVLNAIAAYLLTDMVVILAPGTDFYDIASIHDIPIKACILSGFLLFGMITALEVFFETKGLPVFLSSVLYSLSAVCIKTSDVYFTVCCIAVIGILTCYLIGNNLLTFRWHLSDRMLVTLVIMEYVIISGLTAYACVLRYRSYNASTFDFGIFAQMYENMAKTGLMTVSCERNVIDSHLLRHFSPIFYVLLPFYMLFRTPSFLAAIQPIIVLSGVLPLFLTAKHRQLSNPTVAVLASVFLCYPTFTAACYYDFHENLFLTPVLLWLMYFIECDHPKGIATCTVLTAMIKEDAVLYLCCIGLYLIFYKCRKMVGISIITFSLTVFLAATSYINAFGDNTLSTQHYGNLIPPGSHGMASALQTVVWNPGYLMTQLLSADKIVFLLQMLLPLMLVPLMSKQLSQQILILPLGAVSLITTYPYQYDIDFQYSFGTGALLICMTAENISLWKHEAQKKVLLTIMPIAAALLMLNHALPKYHFYRNTYSENLPDIALTDEVIAGIDPKASVTASTFLVPRLYQHEELYMLDHDCIMTDYVLIDKRFREEHSETEHLYHQMGYTQIYEQGYVIVLQKPE